MFKDLFLIIGDNWEIKEDKPIVHREKCALDHGIVSAITYLKMLDKAETIFRKRGNSPLKFKNWPANQNAILGIALHNFKEIDFELLKDLQVIGSKCKLNLSSRNEKSLIAYLLMVCDSIQNWERNSFKSTDRVNELEYILIEENKIFLQVVHNLGREEDILEYLEKFLKNMIKLKTKLPFKIIIDLHDSNIKIKSIEEELNKLDICENILAIPPIDKYIFLINIKHKISENIINLEIKL